MFFMAVSEVKENKPDSGNTFQVSLCITFPKITVAKSNHIANLRIRVGEHCKVHRKIREYITLLLGIEKRFGITQSTTSIKFAKQILQVKELAGISLKQNLSARIRHQNINLIYFKEDYSKLIGKV